MNGEDGEPHAIYYDLGVGEGEVYVGAEASLGVDDSDDVDVTRHAEEEGEYVEDYLGLQVEVAHVQGRLLTISVT